MIDSAPAAAATVAVTGATGFLGRHVVVSLAARGFRVRLLARREPIATGWEHIKPEIVLGALEDSAALRRLVSGADAVLHLAGAIKARNDEEFFRINQDGSRALATAVAASGSAAHFVQVSSLAARHPELSGYAASKRAGETAVLEVLGPGRVSIVRPPAVYGPGDRETLIFFKLASNHLIPLPGVPAARISLIHVSDAARLLTERLAGTPSGRAQAIADGRPEGYGWRQILDAAAAAVGKNAPRYLSLPAGLLRGFGAGAGAVASVLGRSGMVNAGKIRELLHDDWSIAESELVQEYQAGAQVDLRRGFAETAVWYRQAGWL